MGDVKLLDRRMLSAREAARQLRIPATTLIQWLEGAERQGRWYDPVLRAEPTGSRDMTWGEMVEARYLRAYRQKNVSMQQLRPFITKLREDFGVPYPLAHFKPFIGAGRRLLLEAQESVNLPGELSAIYEVKTGQLILDPRATEFLDRVEFAAGGQQEAERIYPAGRESPVVMDPQVASASTSVHGIRTEILVELADAGVPVETIAEDFDLPPNVVRAAVAYEWSHAA
jgi:uncharacterized protein (DUF433 family)